MATETLTEATPVAAQEPHPDVPQDAPLPWRGLLLMGGTLLLSLLLVLLVPLDAVQRLGVYGYVGVFVLTLLSSATIVVPSPALATAFVAGGALNPLLVGLIAGVAAGLGESTGYMAGYGGSSIAMRSRWYVRVEQQVQRHGVLAVLVLAAVPSPLIDLAGIAAGVMRLGFARYLLACIAGKTVRFLVVAWAGAQAVQLWRWGG